MPTPRRGREFWSRLIAEYESSPGAQDDFADAHGVKVATFRSWLYRLRREGTSQTFATPATASFVELKARRGSGGCVMRIGEAEIEFSELPPATYLAELARAAAS